VLTYHTPSGSNDKSLGCSLMKFNELNSSTAMAINILMTRLKIQNFVRSFMKVLTLTQSQRAIQTHKKKA
jgi:hypothetical protein